MYNAALESEDELASAGTVNDGQWHDVALVLDGAAGTITAYLDGRLMGSMSGTLQYIAGSNDQIGMGFTEGWQAAVEGWNGFVGEIDDVRVWSLARTADEIFPGHEHRAGRRDEWPGSRLSAR